MNIDPEQELPLASFRSARQLMSAVRLGAYDLGALETFRSRYIETAEENNTAAIVKFMCQFLPETKVEAEEQTR